MDNEQLVELFQEWKQHKITKLLYKVLSDRIKEGQSEIAETAGEDPGLDKFRRGIIVGYRQILDFDILEELE